MSIRACRGVTLIELVVFIVIVGVAIDGVFAAFNTMTAASADPQVRKQVLAIAESLMEEVALMPFTWCDPDDPAAPSATGTGSCATTETGATTAGQATTAEPGETRYSTATPFDNVNDYHRFLMTSGIQDIANNTISGLGSYSADLRVTQAGLASGGDAIAATEALLISITVTGPGGVSTTLEGYRTRYPPITLP